MAVSPATMTQAAFLNRLHGLIERSRGAIGATGGYVVVSACAGAVANNAAAIAKLEPIALGRITRNSEKSRLYDNWSGRREGRER